MLFYLEDRPDQAAGAGAKPFNVPRLGSFGSVVTLGLVPGVTGFQGHDLGRHPTPQHRVSHPRRFPLYATPQHRTVEGQ